MRSGKIEQPLQSAKTQLETWSGAGRSKRHVSHLIRKQFCKSYAVCMFLSMKFLRFSFWNEGLRVFIGLIEGTFLRTDLNKFSLKSHLVKQSSVECFTYYPFSQKSGYGII